jgi:hypothetical protein
MWQDALFLTGGGLLALGFLPTLFGRQKPSRWTAAMFVLVLTSFGGGFLSLDLYWSAGSQFVGAAMWAATIFQQRGEKAGY